eukprot:1898861-Alexandrium_andersonii.AAC.1
MVRRSACQTRLVSDRFSLCRTSWHACPVTASPARPGRAPSLRRSKGQTRLHAPFRCRGGRRPPATPGASPGRRS